MREARLKIKIHRIYHFLFDFVTIFFRSIHTLISVKCRNSVYIIHSVRNCRTSTVYGGAAA